MTSETKSLVFISYKHAEPSTRIARKLRNALEVISEALDFTVFLDDEDLRAGEGWQQKVNEALAGMTHFIALLTDDYLLKESTECRRELLEAINRFENGKQTILLFVLVDDIKPSRISFGADRKAGRLVSDDPKVTKLGDIHFLGPYNPAKQLVRLDWENEGKLRDQIKQLIDHFERTLPQPEK